MLKALFFFSLLFWCGRYEAGGCCCLGANVFNAPVEAIEYFYEGLGVSKGAWGLGEAFDGGASELLPRLGTHYWG